MVDFKTPRNASKMNSKIKILDFRTADFSMFRDLKLPQKDKCAPQQLLDL